MDFGFWILGFRVWVFFVLFGSGALDFLFWVISGLGFGVWGLGFGVWGVWVLGFGFWVWGVWVLGSGFLVFSFGLWVWVLGFRVMGSGFRCCGLRVRGQSSCFRI